jgi:hypothetical protein
MKRLLASVALSLARQKGRGGPDPRQLSVTSAARVGRRSRCCGRRMPEASSRGANP